MYQSAYESPNMVHSSVDLFFVVHVILSNLFRHKMIMTTKCPKIGSTSCLLINFLLLISTLSLDAEGSSSSRRLKKINSHFTPCGNSWCNSRQLCVPVGNTVEELLSSKEMCVCKDGWTGESCMEDIDECKELDPCSFPGGFCVDHSPDDGKYSCGCDTSSGGWRVGPTSNEYGPTSCIDVNECLRDDACAPNSKCKDLVGSYECKCNEGFEGDGFTKCKPINSGSDSESTVENTPSCEDLDCDVEISYCEMMDTKPACRCLPGYYAAKIGLACHDVDECQDSAKNNCHKHAACENLPGSFSCSCNDGYIDAFNGAYGTDCKQINECEEGQNDCDLDLEVCVDHPPPQKWKCIPKTEAPITPLPTPAPIMPTIAPIVPPPSPVSIVLQLQSDNMGEETSYRLYDVLNQTLLWRETNVTSNFEVIKESTIDPTGCYFFLIHDLFADGICCKYGNGTFSLRLDNVEIPLLEFNQTVRGSEFQLMAHAYFGSGCQSMQLPFLPSALDSSCANHCGDVSLPTGCSCSCTMDTKERSSNKQIAFSFGDCCPDYVSQCASTIDDEEGSGLENMEAKIENNTLSVRYIKSQDTTLPSITLFDNTGPIASGKCDDPLGCEILLELSSVGIVCSDLLLRIEEDSSDWIYPEDVLLTAVLNGVQILKFHGNIFPSILSFDCGNL
jgi:Calcium-binding EGF domain